MIPNSARIIVVPVTGFANDQEVIRDCAVATTLMQKIMQEDPSLTHNEAFSQLQRLLEKVCVFPWDRMQIVQK